MNITKALLVAAVHLVPGSAWALTAPNVVPISGKLVTSGQPPASQLATLGAEGFEAVIYLAPSSVQDAVPQEAELLARQGIEFVPIPIPFEAPAETHLQAVAAALDRLAGKKVLVHCQVNFRASTVTFLYRVINRREDPAKAYEAVSAVWVPQGAWRRLVVEQLGKHGIAFEPY